MIKYFLALILIIFSSFIKCFVDSKIDKSFFTRRSNCDNCKRELEIKNLIPIYSYLKQKGKCEWCKNEIHISVFLYELAALAIGILYIIFADRLLTISFLEFAIVMILLFISIEDYFTLEINPKLQGILLFLVSVNLFIKWDDLSIFSSLSLVIIYNLIYFLVRGGIGYGDIKLFSMLALNLTFIDGIYLFLYTFIFAGFYAIYLLVSKKYKADMKVALALYISLAYIFILIRGEFLW